MNKQQVLAMSLPFGLKCQFWGSPNKEHYNHLGEWIGVSNYDYNKWRNARILKIGTLRAIIQRKGYQKCSVGKAALYTKTEWNPTPILHPLSDLTKEIEHKGEKFVPIERIKESQHHLFFRTDIEKPIDELQFSEVMKLVEWYFDIAGLIEKGEAIDVNTLPENPYK